MSLSSKTACRGTAVQAAAPRRATAAARRAAVRVTNETCLIVNTKGGGHAFLGLHLARKLLSQGHSVTLMNDGDKAKLASKEPYASYDALAQLGARVVWGSPTDPRTFPPGAFDVVYDNNGKDLAACQPLIDHFRTGVKHYVFVGSAGAYAANSVEPMHVEGDKRKDSAGHVEVERYLERLNLPYTVFQPLYIYGDHTNKDCEQWFMDRILRGRPVPIPAPGLQLTSLSHVEDLADMMAAVPGCEAAKGQHFNLCSDRAITLDGIANTIARAAGKKAQIVHYDPKSIADLPKGAFPFRAVHFFASPDKAKRLLSWAPNHNFVDDVEQRVWEYIRSGRLDKQIDFSSDDLILAAAGKKAGAAASFGGANGTAASGQFSAEQLAFLERKRAASGSPPAPSAAGSGASAGAGPARSLSPAAQEAVQRGVLSQQEATSLSVEQLEFLLRKRSASPVAVRA